MEWQRSDTVGIRSTVIIWIITTECIPRSMMIWGVTEDPTHKCRFKNFDITFSSFASPRHSRNRVLIDLDPWILNKSCPSDSTTYCNIKLNRTKLHVPIYLFPSMYTHHDTHWFDVFISALSTQNLLCHLVPFYWLCPTHNCNRVLIELEPS